MAGTVIGGRYSLRSAVGNGGMGTVWRAADTLLRRDVAVKEVVLPPGLAPSDRDAMYERTLREARAAAALQHPAVVQVYDVVTEGGRPWIVMELLEARSLAEMVIEDGPLAPRAVAKIGIALLGALEVAHANGVLHRDVKPANVLICTDGRCVLTDFGVARMPTDVQLTTPGMVLGSPHFISPERAMGQNFGPPSDLFSLGVTLYTAIEGRPPFDKGDPIETMHSVVEDPPATPVRSGPLLTVLMGLLEKDPARRMDVPTARGLLRELLAGPLANNATINNMTDPYAVVRVAQPPAPPPPPPAPAAAPGQIGGRAMLAPGESLTDRLAKLRAGERPAPTTSSAPLDQTSPNALGGLDTPTGAMSPPAGGHEQTQVIGGYQPAAGQRPGQQYGTPAGGQYGTPAQPGQTYGSPAGGQYGSPAGQQYGNSAGQQYGAPAQSYGTPEQQWGAPGQQWVTPPGRPDDDRAGGLAGVVAAVKQLPAKTRYALAGGLVVLLLIIGVLVIPGGDDKVPTPQAGTETTAPPQPAIPMQEHRAKGVTVLVPEGWERSSGGGYFVDFFDPDDDGRKVRIISEPFAGTSALRWAEIAESYLKKNKTCPAPYKRVEMTDEVELAGRPGAQFEYTCGSGDTMRHGIWRAVIFDGKAYSFYLTSTDARFEESRPIFDEMTTTFKLNAAS